MSTTFKTVSDKEYGSWFENQSERLSNRSAFHDPAWLGAAAKGVNFELRYIGVYEGTELVSVIPGFLTRRGPLRLFGSPLRGTMTSWLGPVSLDADNEKLLEVIRAAADFARGEWGASYVRFSLRRAPVGEMPDWSSNWEEQRPGVYCLDLSQGTAALWDRLKSDCRRNIRKAQTLGIEIVPLADAHLFYQILDETLKRHGSASWQSERFFQLVIDRLMPRDLLWAWGAKYQGKIIATGLFFRDNQEVHFISGASLSEYGSLPTSYLLHWHAIETATLAGLRAFYTNASGVRSIDQFKESFRPVLDTRYCVIWAPSHVRYAEQVFRSSYPHLLRFAQWVRRR